MFNEFSKMLSPAYKDRRSVRVALNEIEKYTCVKFREGSNADKHYIYVSNQVPRCFTQVGYVHEEAQGMSLGSGECLTKAGIIHEFLHALGFTHQIRTPNRDKYVKVLWENIDQRYVNNFQKYNDSDVTDFGYAYDYQSVMNYESYAFSKNKKPTIVATSKGAENMGKAEGLSPIDIVKINKFYNCTDNYYFKYYQRTLLKGKA